MKTMINKFKALIQWFMSLEVQEHRHWCKLEPEGYNSGRCEHQSSCWYCTGLFCSHTERKDCPNCAAMSDEEKSEISRKLHEQWLASRQS